MKGNKADVESTGLAGLRKAMLLPQLTKDKNEKTSDPKERFIKI